jgi:hypothetical protein
VTSDVQNSNRADQFHSVFGCFLIFLRGVRPLEVVFGCRGCKICVPAPTRADLAGYNNFGYQNRFWLHIAKELVPRVSLYGGSP